MTLIMLVLTKTPVKTKTANTWVTNADVKKQLNIESTFTDDDDYIDTLIEVAYETVEDDCNADFSDTSNVLEYDIDQPLDRIIRICQAPLRNLSKIEYKTDSGSYQTLDASTYKVTEGFHWFTIELLSIPTADWLKFTFTTGYTNTTYPKKLRHAVVLKAMELFDTERSSYVVGTISTNINTYGSLIAKHRRQYFG